MNVLPLPIQVRVIAALVEGASIRSTERMVHVHRDTAMRLALRVGDGCARLHDKLVKDVLPSTLQLDEIWAYVFKKQGHLRDADPAEFGDQYTFVGLDADHKLAVSYLTGKRTAESTRVFIADLRRRVLGKPQITTDGFKPYIDAIESAFGTKVHYGQAIKHFENEDVPDAVRRYSPGRLTSVDKHTVFGSPDEALMSTAYVERSNLTMRMGMRRFTRLTNGFSKTVRGHQAAVSLFVMHYNFCRVHMTLRVTPAMDTGLADHVWSIEELLAAVDALPDDGDVPTVAPIVAMVPASRSKFARSAVAPKDVRVDVSSPTPDVENTDLVPPQAAQRIASRALPEPPDAASDFRWMW